jgi:DNA-binding MarR family transcriptional regulator
VTARDEQFDHTQLDDLIHSRLRLAVMAVLAAVDRAEFTFLRDKVNATDGNLSTHLRKLEEAGYIKVAKRFVDRKPVTDYSITRKGREAMGAYVQRLEKLVGETRR